MADNTYRLYIAKFARGTRSGAGVGNPPVWSEAAKTQTPLQSPTFRDSPRSSYAGLALASLGRWSFVPNRGLLKKGALINVVRTRSVTRSVAALPPDPITEEMVATYKKEANLTPR